MGKGVDDDSESLPSDFLSFPEATIGSHVLISPFNRNRVNYLFMSPIFSLFAHAVCFGHVGSIAVSDMEGTKEKGTPEKAKGKRVGF